MPTALGSFRSPELRVASAVRRRPSAVPDFLRGVVSATGTALLPGGDFSPNQFFVSSWLSILTTESKHQILLGLPSTSVGTLFTHSWQSPP